MAALPALDRPFERANSPRRASGRTTKRQLRWLRAVGALVTAMLLIGAARAAQAESTTPDTANRPITLPKNTFGSGVSPVPKESKPPDAATLAAMATDPLGPSRPISAPTSSFLNDATRTIVALVAVVALALVLKRVLRKLGDPLAARRPSGVVQVLARFPFAKGQQIVLVEVGRRVLCLHQGAQSTATLCSFDDRAEVADLKARIEAGSDARQVFDRELTRSMERSPERTLEGSADPRAPRQLLVTETVDLTRGPRRSRLPNAGGGRR